MVPDTIVVSWLAAGRLSFTAFLATNLVLNVGVVSPAERDYSPLNPKAGEELQTTIPLPMHRNCHPAFTWCQLPKNQIERKTRI
jgi:hypothetical protein